MGPKFGVVKSCEAIGLKVSTYYYKRIDWEKRDKPYIEYIEDFLINMPQSGYRSIADYVNNKLPVNKKRIQRICKKYGYQVVIKKRFKPPTTDSNHNLKKYPDLLGENRISGNFERVIVGDITAFSTMTGDGFVATLLDLTNREPIGIAVSASNNTDLALAALNDAIKRRQDFLNYVHHTDSDVRYCSEKYTDKLKSININISMCKGNAYENAHAESFNAALKRQEINISEYQNVAEAEKRILAFRDKYVNIRPHSSLGGQTPLQVGYKKGIYGKSNKPNYPHIHNGTIFFKSKNRIKETVFNL